MVDTTGEGESVIPGRRDPPDVIVTDDPDRAMGSARRRRSGAMAWRVVVLVTVHDKIEVSERGYAAGALACVVKLAASDDLVLRSGRRIRGERHTSTRFRYPALL